MFLLHVMYTYQNHYYHESPNNTTDEKAIVFSGLRKHTQSSMHIVYIFQWC